MRAIPFAAALLGAALLTTAALADDATEREARALNAEGTQRIDDGDYVGALERFRAAYAKWPNAKILLNIGTMLRQLGKNAEAADAYALYLSDPAADPAKRPEVEKLLRDLDARVAKLSVVVDDRRAVVRVDGKPMGKPGGMAELRVEPGPHAVSAEREGAPPALANVNAVAGQEARVTLHLAAPAGAPPEPPAPPPMVVVPPAATPPAAVADTPRPESPSLSHRGQFGALLRADIDGQSLGIIAAPGLAYGIGDYVEINTCALIGKSKGVEPGATVLLLRGAWKPRLSVGVPIFFVDGAYPGVHAGAGVQWDPIRHFGVFVDAGVSVFPSVPDGYQKVVFLPSIGIEPRL